MTRLVAIFAYYIGLDRLFYWLNRRAKRILTFHNVLPDELYVRNIANGVSCSAGEFRAVIGELKRKWKFSTDLFDPATVTITFDDGYLNQYEVAADILHKEGDIPAMLFSSGDVATGKMLLVDELLHWAAYAPADVISKMGFSSGRELWIRSLWPRYSKDSETHGRRLYEELDVLYPFEKMYEALDPSYRRLRLTGTTPAQLQDLRERGWQIGWHTRSHSPLSQFDEIGLRDELSRPENMRTVCLSYPYGREDSVGLKAIELAQELGFPCAVSNMNESAWNSNRFFLPRTSLSADRYLLHFELSGVKFFLRHRRLLPCFTRKEKCYAD